MLRSSCARLSFWRRLAATIAATPNSSSVPLSELDFLAPRVLLVNYTAKTYNKWKEKKKRQTEDRSWPSSRETAVQVTETFYITMLFRDRLKGQTV